MATIVQIFFVPKKKNKIAQLTTQNAFMPSRKLSTVTVNTLQWDREHCPGSRNTFILFTTVTRFGFYAKFIISLNHYRRTLRRNKMSHNFKRNKVVRCHNLKQFICTETQTSVLGSIFGNKRHVTQENCSETYKHQI